MVTTLVRVAICAVCLYGAIPYAFEKAYGKMKGKGGEEKKEG